MQFAGGRSCRPLYAVPDRRKNAACCLAPVSAVLCTEVMLAAS